MCSRLLRFGPAFVPVVIARPSDCQLRLLQNLRTTGQGKVKADNDGNRGDDDDDSGGGEKHSG